MFGGYRESKLKPTLKMAVSRFNMASNKKSALINQQKREIAKLLAEKPPKEEKARIRAEALIRDDGTIEAYEILQLSCELICERIKLITAEKCCPDDLIGTISTLIWASTRVDIKELTEVRKQFRSKYGKQFIEAALNNENGILNERIVAKLSVQPPTAFLVQTYLEKIADQFEVDWEPLNKIEVNQLSAPMAAPVGYSVEAAPGSGFASVPFHPPTVDAEIVGCSGGDGDDDDDGRGGGGQRSNDVNDMNIVGSNNNIHDGSDNKNNGGTQIPVAKVMTSNTAAASGTNNDESDIFVPPFPPQGLGFDKPCIFIPPPAPGAKTTGLDSSNDGGDDDDDKDSFAALQARFNNLSR